MCILPLNFRVGSDCEAVRSPSTPARSTREGTGCVQARPLRLLWLSQQARDFQSYTFEKKALLKGKRDLKKKKNKSEIFSEILLDCDISLFWRRQLYYFCDAKLFLKVLNCICACISLHEGRFIFPLSVGIGIFWTCVYTSLKLTGNYYFGPYLLS